MGYPKVILLVVLEESIDVKLQGRNAERGVLKECFCTSFAFDKVCGGRWVFGTVVGAAIAGFTQI